MLFIDKFMVKILNDKYLIIPKKKIMNLIHVFSSQMVKWNKMYEFVQLRLVLIYSLAFAWVEIHV